MKKLLLVLCMTGILQSLSANPDLLISRLSLNKSAAYVNTTVKVNFTETNNSTFTNKSHVLAIGLSTSSTPSASTPILWQQSNSLTTSSQNFSIDVTIPSDLTTGNYYIIVATDKTNRIIEDSELNNFLTAPISISSQLPDFGFSYPYVDPKLKECNSEITCIFNCNNNSLSDLLEDPTINIYISTNDVLDDADIQLGQTIREDHNHQQSAGPYTLPSSVEQGEYYIIIKVDPDNQIPEVNETNNTIISPVTIQNKVDLQVSYISLSPYHIYEGNDITISYTVVNASDKPSLASEVKFMIHPDDDNVYTNIETWSIPALDANESASLFKTVTIPSDSYASRYNAILTVDPDNNILESDEFNNHSPSTLGTYSFVIQPKTTVIGNLFLTSQAEIDEISNLGYDKILGDIIIDEDQASSIINTDGLLGLREANCLYIRNNESLNDLSGLSNLKCSSSLCIFNNTSLESLEGLENLFNIKIEGPITASPKLKSIGESISPLFICNNLLLKDFCGIAGWYFRFSTDEVSLENNKWNPTYQQLSYKCAQNPPVANAGEAIVIDENILVTLSAESSSDADNDTLIYLWVAPEGITLSTVDAMNSTFMAPETDDTISLVFILKVSDGIDTVETTLSIKVNNKISTQEAFDISSSVLIYPNPVKNKLYINSEKKIRLIIKVFNLQGNLIISSDINSGETIDFSKLQPGIYNLLIDSSQCQIRKKIIKE